MKQIISLSLFAVGHHLLVATGPTLDCSVYVEFDSTGGNYFFLCEWSLTGESYIFVCGLVSTFHVRTTIPSSWDLCFLVYATMVSVILYVCLHDSPVVSRRLCFPDVSHPHWLLLSPLLWEDLMETSHLGLSVSGVSAGCLSVFILSSRGSLYLLPLFIHGEKSLSFCPAWDAREGNSWVFNCESKQITGKVSEGPLFAGNVTLLGRMVLRSLLKLHLAWHSIHLLLPADQDTELSTPPTQSLPACHHVSCRYDLELIHLDLSHRGQKSKQIL